VSLRELLTRSLLDRPGAPDRDPLEGIEGRVDRRRRRRRVTSAGALVGVVAVVSAIAIVVGQSGGGRHTDVQVAPRDRPAGAPDARPRRSRRRPVSGLAAGGARVTGATVAIGDEIVVWGGDLEAFNVGLPGPDRVDTDGAAFSTTKSHVADARALPVCPRRRSLRSRAATRDSVVVARGKSVAEWDPATNTWRARSPTRARRRRRSQPTRASSAAKS